MKKKYTKVVGLIDADLLDNGTRHPNLALMKISGFLKAEGTGTSLLLDYNELNDYTEVWMSKVFTTTKIPAGILERQNIKYGGTGFFLEKAPNLPDKIEHHMPDYHLYDKFIEKEVDRGIKENRYLDYKHYSIGFTTRGCFRKCKFCVNKKYNKVIQHSDVREFLDKSRKYIYLWDDNIFGYEKWREIFDRLNATEKRFQFRQGLDIRLLTKEKAEVLSKSNYIGDYIFAFDHLKDKDLIINKLKLWRPHTKKTTKLYILCAYESQDLHDIIGVFKRLKILMQFRCIPYIMRFNTYKSTEFEGMYINLARWCNQPNIFKKMSFAEFCEANGSDSSTMRYFNSFKKKYPSIAKEYFGLKFEKEAKY
ncbi:MAG: hypothetical protein NTY76_00275 [Candidatus Omnitrophica bacterium]|nr:hypothetical protein [Candidatus Omnitrophota bacterium]